MSRDDTCPAILCQIATPRAAPGVAGKFRKSVPFIILIAPGGAGTRFAPRRVPQYRHTAAHPTLEKPCASMR
jgi:hypothetical protein